MGCLPPSHPCVSVLPPPLSPCLPQEAFAQARMESEVAAREAAAVVATFLEAGDDREDGTEVEGKGGREGGDG